eukprot:7309235-Pyramimonas_sp.AAC.1
MLLFVGAGLVSFGILTLNDKVVGDLDGLDPLVALGGIFLPTTRAPLIGPRPEYIPSHLTVLVPALSIYPLASLADDSCALDWSPP